MKQNSMHKKGVVITIIALFIGMSILPATGGILLEESIKPTFYENESKNPINPVDTQTENHKRLPHYFIQDYESMLYSKEWKSKLQREQSRYKVRETPSEEIVWTDISNMGDYTPHDPIEIDGNGEFTEENGVTGGNGTANDPFIIKNWIIVYDNVSKYGILIRNTDAYFIIRNCTISNFLGWEYTGIGLFNVENGKIRDSDMFNNFWGIRISDSSHIEMFNCTSHDNNGEYACGISGFQCSNIKIDSCECYNNNGRVTWGIKFYRSSNVIIENSRIYNNTANGIEFFTDDSNKYPNVYNIIKDCTIYNNIHNSGIFLWSTRHAKHAGYNRIVGCEIYNNGHWEEPPIDNAMPGITIWNLHNNIVENCDIHHNGDGVAIAECSNNIIRNCSIHDQWMPGFMGNGVVIIGTILDLAFAWNNAIEHCDIYNQDGGIYIIEALRTKVYKNNILDNNYAGIDVFNFIGISTAQINYNNICGNGYKDDKWGYGLSASIVSFVDARNNWWNSTLGPSRLFFPNRGDKLIKKFSVVQYRPWAKEPISDAGIIYDGNTQYNIQLNQQCQLTQQNSQTHSNSINQQSPTSTQNSQLLQQMVKNHNDNQ